MVMDRRMIINKSCILIVFVIFAIMANKSNCNAVRHLLQTSPVNETVNDGSTVIDVGALTGNEILIGNITVISFGTVTGFLDVLGGNSTLNGSITGIVNGVSGFNGFLTLIDGTLNGTLHGAGSLTDITISGSTSWNGTNGSQNVTLTGVATINGLVNVPLSGNGILTLLTISLGGSKIVATLNAILKPIIG